MTSGVLHSLRELWAKRKSAQLSHHLAYGRSPILLANILVAFVLLMAFLISGSVYRERQATLRGNLGQNLVVALHSATTVFNQAYGTLVAQGQGMVSSNVLRLLVLELAEQTPTVDTRRSLDNKLKTMIVQGEILSCVVLDKSFGILTASNDRPADITEVQREAMTKVKEAGDVEVLPATLNNKDMLTFDLVLPIFPPTYVTEGANVPIGYLLLNCSVNKLFKNYNRGKGDIPIGIALIQSTEDKPLVLHPSPESGCSPLHPYAGPAERSGIFSISETGGQELLAVSVPLSGTPWAMMAQTPAHLLQEQESSLLWRIIFVAAGCVLAVVAALLVIWWVLVGAKARAVAEELHSLYAKVNAQGQLLTNINSAIRDGIVLTDANDTIHYVNTAFCRIVGITRDFLLMHRFDITTGIHTDLPINPYRYKALHEGAMVTFTEKITNGGAVFVYRVSSAPYRNASGRVEGVVSVYCDITEILQTQAQAEKRMAQVIQVLVQTIEMIDPYLSGQCAFTARLCQMLGEEMGLDEKDKADLRTAALLSRIGTTRLPHELRTKQEAYTPEEMKEVEKHVQYAADMLSSMNFSPSVQGIIYEMHENMDGTGYPKGLRGEKISPLSRILSVANTFCALMRPRGYRAERELDEALEVLQCNRYDQQVVQVLRGFAKSPRGAAFIQDLTGA